MYASIKEIGPGTALHNILYKEQLEGESSLSPLKFYAIYSLTKNPFQCYEIFEDKKYLYQHAYR